MTIEAGLFASRFIHYAALTILFGAALFPFYAFGTDATARARRRMRGWLIALAAFALASAISWLAFTAAGMQGDIAGAIDPETLSATITETPFGTVWTVRLALLLFLAVIVLARRDRKNAAAGFVELLIAAAALAGIALTGHTLMQEGTAQTIRVIADALHLLAAGAWLGGIFALLLLLVTARRGSEDDERIAADALQRFSPIGYVAVATLVASGTISSLYMLGSFAAFIETQYGLLLLAKLALFALMLGLAAGNRFVLVPRLGTDTPRRATLSAFTRQVALEQIVGLGVLGIVAILGMSEPPM